VSPLGSDQRRSQVTETAIWLLRPLLERGDVDVPVGSRNYRASTSPLSQSIALKNSITIGLPAKIQMAAAMAM